MLGVLQSSLHTLTADFGDEFEVGLTVILDALTRSIPGDGRQP